MNFTGELRMCGRRAGVISLDALCYRTVGCLFALSIMLAACGGEPPTAPPAGPTAWGPTAALASNAPLTTAPKVAVGVNGIATACWSQAGLPGAQPSDVPFIGFARSTTATAWSAAEASPTLAAGSATQIALIGGGAPANETTCAFRVRGIGPDLIQTLVLPAPNQMFINGIYGGTGTVEQLAFASNANGTQAAAWVESIGGVPRVLFSMRLAFTGWSSALPVQSNPGVAGDQPVLAINSSDRVMVAWREGSGSAVVRARTTTLTGAAPGLDADTRINPQSTSSDQRQPRLTAMNNGEFVALWEQRDAGSIAYVLRANRSSAGAWPSQPTTVDASNEQADQAHVHTGPLNTAIAVWRRGDGVWASQLSLGSWSAPQALASGLAGIADQLASAVDGQGNAVAVWVQHGAADDLYYSRYAPSTNTASVPALLEAGEGAVSAPAIALNVAGVAAVAWLQLVSGHAQPDVLARVAR